MLKEISIKDFAIIDKLSINFESGMTALTGETGAGKSIIIDAVGLLAGGRGSQHFIRTGENKSVLQGLFDIPHTGTTAAKLDEFGIDHDDDSVILQRELYKNGRNICRVNGMLVNTSTLKKIGETLVDIYGQNEHQTLMQSDKHLLLLDEFIGEKLSVVLSKYQLQYQQYLKLKKQLAHKNQNEKEWAQRLDMLQYQVNEIENADLVVGEEESLVAEKNRLNNFQAINDSLNQALANIDGDENISPIDMIGDAMSAIEDIENLDDAFKPISENIKSAFYMLQDASKEVSNQMDTLEFDPHRLEEVEARLSTIYELKHKYGDSIQQILKYYEKISMELQEMQAEESSGNDLETQLQSCVSDLNELGQQLHQIRQQGAKILKTKIQQQLADLYMDKTVFEVNFKQLPQATFTANGIETIEFYIQTNPGEALQPLTKIASGGELSRIMLALKTIFSKMQGVTSIIFDEVDTGVSGRVAQAIAEKIHHVSLKSQALCITHLPQVAAMADHQYYIAKHVDNDNRTETSIELLHGKARIEELARMLAGTTVTKLAIDHAEELLKLADAEKAKKMEL
ncbi:DNA repair protein RecN [Fructilactobacillus frigidiflavus]|uniref:DNA repair protein RecN n=1 Tax=Fructilactobacillus frigidiflavus TaxID=3242688 RepID=UPI003756389B